ncbi:hypothetical protein ABIB57_003653 [Devosia sp. UYZn731]|uniref:hypothetical protein n=1 Tax=Devosia sp. UYZn731 TaxID=3156345 RepID=UPI0033987D02
MAIDLTPAERLDVCANLVGLLLDRTEDVDRAAGLVRTTVTALLSSSYDHDHANDRYGAVATLEAAIAKLDELSSAIDDANNADARRLCKGGANV